MDKAGPFERGKSASEWKRPAFTFGGLLVAAGICGAIAGLSLKGDEAPAVLAAPHAPSLVSRRRQLTTLSASSRTPAAEAPAQALVGKAAPRSAPGRMVPKKNRASRLEEEIALDEADTSTPPENESQKLDPARSAVDVTQPAISLPLSSTIIARTIERIGYPCGTIASASAGKVPGTFRVTCSSGDSYRAAPVGGRYHFRRAE